MITADQLLCHAIGDYLLQSHWMAVNKTKSSIAAAYHVIFYTIPFLWLSWSPWALALICGSHFVIDRWRLARFVVAFKNVFFEFSRPGEATGDIDPATGYPADVPQWLAVWLLIIADNILHVICNGLALTYFK